MKFLEFEAKNGKRAFIRPDKVCAVLDHIENKSEKPMSLVCFSGEDDGIILNRDAGQVKYLIECDLS